MSARRTVTLLPLVGSYFRDHLTRARGASPHTLRSYRDTLRLLFRALLKFEWEIGVF